MKRHFAYLLFATLILSINENVFCQKTPDSVASTIKTAKLDSVKDVVQYVSAIQNIETRSLTFGQIADAVWKTDEEYARSLFQISLSKLAVGLNDTAKEISSKNAAYRKIISLIARRDSKWAKNLIKTFAVESGKRAKTNLEIADSLIESDPKLAADFAEQSFQIEITNGLLWFLRNLREKNAAEADRLFLQILNRYPQQTSIDVEQFGILGTYLFTSPNLSPQDFQSISMTRIGNIIFPNITVNLPNISANLIQAYLASAILIINRPTNDVQQRQFKYVLGYLLLPKAQVYAPNLIGELGGAMAALSSAVPVELTSADAYKYTEKKNSFSLEGRIEEIEKIADSYTRDGLYLDVVYQAWLKNDFPIAKLAASKISRTEIQDELEILILFGEANSLLKNKEADLFSAMQAAEKLPVSLEKNMLWLGAAAAAEKFKQAPLVTNTLDSALKTAEKLNDENTPFILLYISGLTAKTDKSQAGTILADAVKSFNKFENIRKPLLVHKVTLEPLRMPFSLAVDGVNLDFQTSFEKAISGNEENGIQIIRDLKDERLKGEAFVALVKSILAKKTAKSDVVNKKIITVSEVEIRKSAVKTVMPVYPQESLKKQTKGIPAAEIQYGEKGDVSDVKILDAPDFETGKSVMTALRQWKFNPNKLKENPVSTRGKITFSFVIDAKGKGEVKNPKQF